MNILKLDINRPDFGQTYKHCPLDGLSGHRIPRAARHVSSTVARRITTSLKNVIQHVNNVALHKNVEAVHDALSPESGERLPALGARGGGAGGEAIH